MSPSRKRCILITGCSQGGAGNALALEFAAQGIRVFATARSLNSMSNLAEEGIETFTLDVTSLESIMALKDNIGRQTGGKLDILYNNAGCMYEAPAIEADPKQVRQMFDTNVFGLFDVVTAFTPLLVAAASDSNTQPIIINVSSILARLPMPFSSAYNASKAAVSAFSDTLRLELGPLGVQVVTLYMGQVSTRLMSSTRINFGPDSLYADVVHKLQQRSEDHNKLSVTADAFAKQVVSRILSSNKNTSYIWKGTNSFSVWLLGAIGPAKVFDSTMISHAGLNDKEVINSIHQRGQRLVGQSLGVPGKGVEGETTH